MSHGLAINCRQCRWVAEPPEPDRYARKAHPGEATHREHDRDRRKAVRSCHLQTRYHAGKIRKCDREKDAGIDQGATPAGG